MIHEEFPHTVTIQAYSKVPDGAGGYKQDWADVIVDMEAFCDTPSLREAQAVFEAQQSRTPFDRNLYYPYRTDIDEKMRCIFENETYELAGKPQDQGGQHEIMKAPLRLIRNGE